MDESATVDSPGPLEVLNQVPSETSTTGKGTVKRKDHDSYLDIGFIETSDNKPQCVTCGKVLPNSLMFPVKMRRHFEGGPSSDELGTTSSQLVIPGTHTTGSKLRCQTLTMHMKNITSNFSQARSALPDDGSQTI